MFPRIIDSEPFRTSDIHRAYLDVGRFYYIALVIKSRHANFEQIFTIDSEIKDTIRYFPVPAETAIPQN